MPYAQSGRARIYWEESGAGEPVLMIIGIGYSHHMWREMRDVMAQHFRVIVFDHRGVGASSANGVITMAAMARDCAAVLDAAGIVRAHVVGLSMGGMIAQEFALRYPRRVVRLALGCTWPGTLRGKWPSLRAAEMLLARMTPRGTGWLVPWLFDRATPREHIEQDLAMILRHRAPAPVVLRELAAVVFWDSYRRLPRLTAETLVVHGENDRLLPAANAQLLARRIPRARLVMLNRAAHVFPTDQPDQTLRTLIGFLKPQDALTAR